MVVEAEDAAGCFREAAHNLNYARQHAINAKTAVTVSDPRLATVASHFAENSLEASEGYCAQGVRCLERLAAALGKKLVDA